MIVRATLSLVQGMETSGGIQSINSYTRIQEWKYYTPSREIQREERMQIPTLGAALKTKLTSSMFPDKVGECCCGSAFRLARRSCNYVWCVWVPQQVLTATYYLLTLYFLSFFSLSHRYLNCTVPRRATGSYMTNHSHLRLSTTHQEVT
jgi:hypothetical protein